MDFYYMNFHIYILNVCKYIKLLTRKKKYELILVDDKMRRYIIYVFSIFIFFMIILNTN